MPRSLREAVIKRIFLVLEDCQRKGIAPYSEGLAEAALTVIAPALVEARAAERERCAKVADRIFGLHSGVARAIRALQDPESPP